MAALGANEVAGILHLVPLQRGQSQLFDGLVGGPEDPLPRASR